MDEVDKSIVGQQLVEESTKHIAQREFNKKLNKDWK